MYLGAHPKKRSERGSTLIMAGVCAFTLVGALGLVADLGRIYIVKNELQSYVDAAALAAAYKLDGSSAGIDAARATAGTGPVGDGRNNQWNFGTQGVGSIVTTFAQTYNGTYDANPASGAGYRFVRVQATANVPMMFLPVLPGVSSGLGVSARAVGGQGLSNSIGDGASPFSPDAINTADPDFGFIRGELYDIKWAPPGQRDKPGGRCPGDVAVDFYPGGGSSDRGYIEIGQGNGNSGLTDAIVNNRFSLPSPLTIGSQIDVVPGNKHVGPALEERFNQDTDTTAANYSSYTGNGRRVLLLPVNDHSDEQYVMGFGAFFLQPNNPCIDDNNKPCCAEYIGPAVKNGSGKSGASGGGAMYEVKLFE